MIAAVLGVAAMAFWQATGAWVGRRRELDESLAAGVVDGLACPLIGGMRVLSAPEAVTVPESECSRSVAHREAGGPPGLVRQEAGAKGAL